MLIAEVFIAASSHSKEEEVRGWRDLGVSGPEQVDGEIPPVAGSFQYEQVRTTGGGGLPDGIWGNRKDSRAVVRSLYDSKPR